MSNVRKRQILHGTADVGSIGSRIAGSSFSGLFTRFEIGHIREATPDISFIRRHSFSPLAGVLRHGRTGLVISAELMISAISA
jgi:hypothetical protein